MGVSANSSAPIWVCMQCGDVVTLMMRACARQVTQYFPRGEQNTSFKWKDYCPSIFSRLRDAFGIDSKDYLLSLAGDK